MTVTLPSPGRMALALVLIVAVFAAAFAAGRANRPRARSVGPAGPVPLQPSAGESPAPAIDAPAGAPPLPALKVTRPATAGRPRSAI